MLVGAITPDQKALAEQILRDEIGVEPSVGQQAIFLVNDSTGMIEWIVGYNSFIGKTCQMHVVNLAGKSITREFLWAAFHYPFVKCGMETVFGVLNSNNERAVNFDKKLGFKEVHRFPGVHDDGGDIVLLQMNRSDCRWVKELKNAA